MRSIRLRCCLPALALLAAGCAGFEEKPLDPRAVLADLDRRTPEGVLVERAKDGEGAPAAPAPFDLSDGLGDAETAAVALVLNPGLRAKRLAIGEARALLVTAGLLPNPEVGVAVRPGIAGASGTTVEADLLLELLRPWERAARKEAAARGIDGARADAAAAEWRTATEARLARIEVLSLARVLRLLDEEVDLRARAADLARRRREAGDGTEIDAVSAALDLAGVERERREARAGLEEARIRLNRVLGLPPGYPLRLEEEGDRPRVVVVDDLADAEIDRRLLEGRAELRAREAAYRKTEAELRLAVYRQYPRLHVGPSFEREADGGNFLGVGASIEIPLLDRNQGEIARLESAREAARAEYEDLLLAVRAEAHGARARLRATREDLEATEAGIRPLVERSRSLLDAALGAREIPVLDWVSAQARILAARREELRTARRYREAVVRMEESLGTFLGHGG
jgi:outer membrane protein TolC